jgi:phospholipid/cholesterol/gamma-HCH transport system substrate-binding protein
MEERILQLRVGIVVILAAIITGTLIFLFSDGWAAQYSLWMRPRTAPGVTRNTPVRKHGILIGRVANVETTDEGVLLQLKINRGQKVFDTEVAQVGTESFLGDAVIEFVPGDVAEPGRQLVEGSEVRNIRVKPNPLEVVDVVIDLKERVADAVDSIRRAADTVDGAGQGITRVTDEFQRALGDEDSDLKVILGNVRKMTENADTALTSFNNVMKRFDEFLSDSEFQGELKQTIKGLPQFFQDARQTMADTRVAIEQFRGVSERADGNLQNLEAFTKSLGEDGPAIVERLKTSLEGIDRLVNHVNEFSQSIRDSEGTLGKIINDPRLYENLNATLENVREVSFRLKPIMADLRVFADSLARDPGQLGVRGAIQRRPAGSGYKGTAMGDPQRDW